MFKRVVIVGVGLLGGSLARDLNANGLANHIVGVGRNPASAEKALELGVVDAIQDLPVALQGADLVVLATPMQAMLPLLEQMRDIISPNTILTDVGSVKTHLYQQVKQHCSQLLPQFVFAHPIAGGETSGVAASRNGLFKEKHLIITPFNEQNDQFVDAVIRLWQSVGANVKCMSLEQHDAVFAKTSHLPHVVAFGLVNFLNQQADREQLFELAAAGFYDFTRIASSDAEMWRDICLTNQDQAVLALDGYIEQLQTLRDHIDRGAQQALLKSFSAAKAARDAGLLKKASEPA